jgi:hypothetical protein
MTTISMQKSSRISSVVRIFIRPMLVLALGLHALLLFVPLPSEQKFKELDDKESLTKINQIFTAKPVSQKPKPTTAIKPTAIKLTNKPAIASKPSAPTLRPTGAAIASSQPKPRQAVIPSSASIAPMQSTDPASVPPNRTPNAVGAQSAVNSKPFESFKEDPAQALHEVLTSPFRTGGGVVSGGSNSANGVDHAENNTVPLEEITRPELLFKPSTNQNPAPQKIALEGLTGLDKQPLLITFPLEDNLNLYSFYQKILEPKLKTIFAETSEVGEYGDGPLYKLTRGSYTAYLSLMPPKKAVGAIISVWSKDPRANQGGAPADSSAF